MSDNIEKEKLDLERSKLKVESFKCFVDAFKWLLLVIGVSISFYFIDLRKVQIEKMKIEGERDFQILASYVDALKIEDPDLWKRRIKLLESITVNEKIIACVEKEKIFIENNYAKRVLYKRLIDSTSILANLSFPKNDEWYNAYKAFFRLYWVDLQGYDNDKLISNLQDFRDLLIKDRDKDKSNLQIQLANKLYDIAEFIKSDIDK